MKKIISTIYIIVFIAFLLLPLLFINTEEGAISDVEGDNLLGNSFSDTGYTVGVEKILKDRIGFHDKIINAYDVLNDSVFNELTSSIYQYGKEGHAFIKLHNNVSYKYYHTQFALLLSSMQEYCESRGSNFYYVFNPEKESIYRRFLPEGVNYSDDWADLFIKYLSKLGVNYIDLRDTLTRVGYEYDVFNKITDTGHWNHTGAFYGMKEITQRINQDIPDLKTLDQSEYNISYEVKDRNTGSNLIINEEIPIYALKSATTDITGDIKEEIKLNSNFSYFQIVQNDSEEASGINRLLLFEDDLYAPFAFSRAKETIVMSCNQNVINFDYYYNIFKPNVVIFENMEYVIEDKYFRADALASLDPHPAIIQIFPKKEFKSSRDTALKKARKYNCNASLLLVSQKEIDRIYLNRSLKNCSYAYIITENDVFDLLTDGTGLLYADLKHGEISEGEDVIIYVLDEDGKGRYDKITVTTEMEAVDLDYYRTTENVSTGENDNYAVSSTTEGNVFSKAVLQLYSDDLMEVKREIGSQGTAGTYEEYFCNNNPTGEYKLLLRAKASLKDEWIAYDVYLEKGKTYKVSFNLDELKEEGMKVSGLKVSAHI